MVNEFLYGRTQNAGYSQLSHLEEYCYTPEDIVGFQYLWKYTAAEGCDKEQMPESRYFYISEASIGPVAQVGKTSFVPAGTSKESGDRDTTLLHKYLFSGNDFRRILKDPDSIFGISDFVGNVEEALSRREEDVIQKSELPDPEGEDAAELLDYFGIPAQKLPELFYAILDAAGDVDSRVYIALPEWNKHATRMAQRLCRRILECLPPYLVSACGFLTYTETFHNGQTNMIPRTVTIIFYPNNIENQKKYLRISSGNYIIDSAAGCFPDMQIDIYTREMVEAMADKFLYGQEDKVWYLFFREFEEYVSWNMNFPPEALSCARKFVQIREELDMGEIKSFRMEEVYYILETYLNCKAFQTPQALPFAMEVLKDFVSTLPVNGDLLNILCDYYMILPDSREQVISWLCNQLLEYSSKPDMYMAILNYDYEDPKLGQELHRRIYQDLDFYPAARQLETIEYQASAGKKEKLEERIELLYSRLEKLGEEWPDFLLDEGTIDMAHRCMEEICIDENRKLRISLDELQYLYQRGNCFVSECEEYRIFVDLSLDIVRETFKSKDPEEWSVSELRQLRKWMNELTKDERILELHPIFDKIQEQLKSMKYLELLERGDGDECVRLWKKEGMRYKKDFLSHLDMDTEPLMKNVSFKNEESFDEFFVTLFLAREKDRDVICKQIMEDDSGLGGIAGLSSLWRHLCVMGYFSVKEKIATKKIMKQTVMDYYNSHKITSADIKKLKGEIEFAEEMGATSYIDNASVIYKLKKLSPFNVKNRK